MTKMMPPQSQPTSLALLTEISRFFRQPFLDEQMWAETLNAIITTMPCHSISIWSVEPEHGSLTCIQTIGHGQASLSGHQVQTGNTLPGQAILQQRTVNIPDVWQHDADMRMINECFHIEIHAALCVPLQAGDSFWGELLLLDEEAERFTDADARLLEPVSTLIALALNTRYLKDLAQQQTAERERAEEALRASQKYARNIIESSLDMIIAVDNDRNILEFNNAAQKVFGYTPEEVVGKHISMLYADAEDTLPIYQHTIGEGEFFGEIRNKRKNGEVFPCLLSASILYDTHQKPIGLMGISRDIMERKRAEQIREALYNISEAAQTTQHLDELYPALREIVGRLMPVENFYIAFYDAATETITYPYYVDNNRALVRSPRKSGNGLADYVLRTGQPLLLTPEIRHALVERGEMKPISFNPTLIDWLGVPLKSEGRVAGILTVQSHSQSTRLSEDEKWILMFVSSQIAAVIARKQAEEDLFKLEKAIETTEVGMTITDTQGRIEYVNPADAAMHGYGVAELIGQNANLFTLPHLRAKEKRERSDALLHWKRERVNVRKDGSIFPVKLISNPIYTKEGERVGNVTICEDITARKKAETLLRESEQRYRSIVENATTGIFQATPDGRFITANPALSRMLGYGSVRDLMETVTNMADHVFVEPTHWQEIAEIIRVTHEPASVETRIHHRDGGEIIAQLNIWAVRRETDVSPIPDSAPSPDGALSDDGASSEESSYYFEGFVENITERKQMEKTLFRHATLLRSVASAMTGLLVNPDFQSAIAQALELLGFAMEVDRIILSENELDPHTGEPVMVQRFTWEKGAQSDPSEALTIDKIPYHPRFTRWYATLQANRPVSGFVRNFPPDERDILAAQHIMSLILVPIMIRDQCWGAIGFHDCHTERQWREEEESILLAMAASIGGAIARKHAETRLINVNTDLTHALESLKHTQTQLVESEKMAALGQLVAGVGHEVNTPLAAIRSAIGDISNTLRQTLENLPDFLLSLSPECRDAFFELVTQAEHKDPHLLPREERQLKANAVAGLRKLEVKNARKFGEMLTNIGVYGQFQKFLPIFSAADAYRILETAYRLSGLRESARTISTAVERASKVVFALKTYAHYDQSGDMIASDIHEGLETVLTLYYNKMKHTVEVRRHYGSLPSVPCYPDELNQVWTNLIHNALQAMDYQGILSIRTATQGRDVVVSITDSGTGIPEDVRQRMFEPFFTTKPQGEGSGLGLDIVRKIVEKHHGDIQVKSRPGETTFSVKLPVTGTQ